MLGMSKLRWKYKMSRIKRNDEVIVISGKDKGKQGKVTKVLSDSRMIVSGINMVKKHQKPNPNTNTKGGIIDKEAPIHTSNVALLNPETNKADKVGFRFEDSKKIRFYKSTGKVID